MENKHAQFIGSIPENYDQYLGPLLFSFSAKELAKRVAGHVLEGEELLEIAAGTGISTKYLREALPHSARILATDLNGEMLEYGRTKRGDFPNTAYEVANALELPYEDARFDAVVCQFGIMFFPDKHKGLTEMLRVLKPGGFLAVSVWGSHEHNPFIKVARDTIASFFEKDPPTFLNVPFAMHNIDATTKLIADAGFTGVKAETVSKTQTEVNVLDFARGLVEGNPSVIELKENPDINIETIVKAVADAIKKEFDSEAPDMPLEVIYFIATKPV